MTLSAVQQQALIILEVKDTPDGRVSTNVAGIWDDEAGHAVVDPKLQVLYTKRRCVSLARGYYADQFDFTAQGDAGLKLGQRIQHYDQLYTQTEQEIERLEKKARSRRGGYTTSITTTVPFSVQDELSREAQPPLALPDPNDPYYAGSPFEPLTSDTMEFVP